MGAMDGTAYFAGTVSYTRKMFMNSTTGANLKKTFFLSQPRSNKIS
jgi:hypothetical protein